MAGKRSLISGALTRLSQLISKTNTSKTYRAAKSLNRQKVAKFVGEATSSAKESNWAKALEMKMSSTWGIVGGVSAVANKGSTKVGGALLGGNKSIRRRSGAFVLRNTVGLPYKVARTAINNPIKTGMVTGVVAGAGGSMLNAAERRMQSTKSRRSMQAGHLGTDGLTLSLSRTRHK